MQKTTALVTRTQKQKGTYVPVVDGFRGLAVLWIILGHVRWRLGAPVPTEIDPVNYVVTASYFGVDLLFIASGFVLFLPAVVNGGLGNFKTYALRRAARIVPAFWVAMLVSYVVAMKVGELKGRGSGGAWVSHLLFLSSFAHPREDLGFGVNSPIWTMSVEVVFYACLPLIAKRYARHPFAGLAIAVALTEVWHAVTTHLESVLGWMGISWADEAIEQAQYRMAHAFPTFVTQFAVGMTAAWLYVRIRENPAREDQERLFNAAAVVSFVAIIAVAALRQWESIQEVDGPLDHWVKTIDRSFIFGGLVLSVALASRQVQWAVGNGMSRFLGTVVYGAYLSHLPLIYLFIHELGLPETGASVGMAVVLAAIVVPLSFAIGVVSYTFLEEPFRKFVRRPLREDRRPRATARPIALTGVRG